MVEQPVETGGWGAGEIFAKVDLLAIDSYSQKKKIVNKCKPIQIPSKLLVTLPLSTSCDAEN